MDPPEPELESPPPPAVPQSSNACALVHHHQAHSSIVAPAALLRVVHTIIPLYAVLIRLAQFASWRRRSLE